MPRITQDLLRKRAEHNECMLSTLEEVVTYNITINIDLFASTRHRED